MACFVSGELNRAESLWKKELTPHFTSEEAHAELKRRNIDFGPFPELEKAVEDDVALLRGSQLVPDDVAISGWVYEVETGEVKQVV